MNTNGIFLNVALLYGAIWALFFWEALVSWIISCCSLKTAALNVFRRTACYLQILKHMPQAWNSLLWLEFVSTSPLCRTSGIVSHWSTLYVCVCVNHTEILLILRYFLRMAFVRVFMSGPVRSHYFPSISKYSSALTLCQTLSACPDIHTGTALINTTVFSIAFSSFAVEL